MKAVELRADLRIADDLQHERGGTTAALLVPMMMVRGVTITGPCGNGLQSMVENHRGRTDVKLKHPRV